MKESGHDSQRPHRVVAVLVLDGVAAFDLGVPGAGLRRRPDPTARDCTRCATCTADGGPVRTSGGFAAVPDAWAGDPRRRRDTVVIPGIHGDLLLTGRPTLEPAEAAALAPVPAGARLVSICTGAFALAAAGLLDGRPATTHWAYADRFRSLFPRVRLNPDVLFVDDGDVLTSAGVGGGHRPVPARRPPRPRQRGGQRGGPALRRAAVAGRRPGAVHRAAAAGIDPDRRPDPLGRGRWSRLDEPVWTWRRWRGRPG